VACSAGAVLLSESFTFLSPPAAAGAASLDSMCTTPFAGASPGAAGLSAPPSSPAAGFDNSGAPPSGSGSGPLMEQQCSRISYTLSEPCHSGRLTLHMRRFCPAGAVALHTRPRGAHSEYCQRAHRRATCPSAAAAAAASCASESASAANSAAAAACWASAGTSGRPVADRFRQRGVSTSAGLCSPVSMCSCMRHATSEDNNSKRSIHPVPMPQHVWCPLK
jgi:hypothetical protein